MPVSRLSYSEPVKTMDSETIVDMNRFLKRNLIRLVGAVILKSINNNSLLTGLIRDYDNCAIGLFKKTPSSHEDC